MFPTGYESSPSAEMLVCAFNGTGYTLNWILGNHPASGSRSIANSLIGALQALIRTHCNVGACGVHSLNALSASTL
jgi:hypothetical protein